MVSLLHKLKTEIFNWQDRFMQNTTATDGNGPKINISTFHASVSYCMVCAYVRHDNP